MMYALARVYQMDKQQIFHLFFVLSTAICLCATCVRVPSLCCCCYLHHRQWNLLLAFYLEVGGYLYFRQLKKDAGCEALKEHCKKCVRKMLNIERYYLEIVLTFIFIMNSEKLMNQVINLNTYYLFWIFLYGWFRIYERRMHYKQLVLKFIFLVCIGLLL